jgi:hypothetical protein
MKNVSRALLILASLDLTRSELYRLVKELHSMPPGEITDRVLYLRENLNREFGDEYRFLEARKKHFRSSDSTVGERVERLLKKEAGLTTRQAVDQLTSQLISMGLVEGRDVPPLSRKSLSDWINRLLQRVPAKDILRGATVLRNEHAHRPGDDWLLSGIHK